MTVNKEHESVMFRDCPRCIGGRMFWGEAEPQYTRALGYVGLCAHCGHQQFTNDLLGIAEDRGGQIIGYRKKWAA